MPDPEELERAVERLRRDVAVRLDAAEKRLVREEQSVARATEAADKRAGHPIDMRKLGEAEAWERKVLAERDHLATLNEAVGVLAAALSTEGAQEPPTRREGDASDAAPRSGPGHVAQPDPPPADQTEPARAGDGAEGAQERLDRLADALAELCRWQPHTEPGLAGLHPQRRAAVEAARAELVREVSSPDTPEERADITPFLRAEMVSAGLDEEEANDLLAVARERATAPTEDAGERCQRCGHENPPWSAPSPLWNAVMRGGSINGEEQHGGIVCAACFMVLAEKQGIASLFRVLAENVNVELETVTPSGRVWDDEQFRWLDPAAQEGGEER